MGLIILVILSLYLTQALCLLLILRKSNDAKKKHWGFIPFVAPALQIGVGVLAIIVADVNINVAHAAAFAVVVGGAVVGFISGFFIVPLLYFFIALPVEKIHSNQINSELTEKQIAINIFRHKENERVKQENKKWWQIWL